jgi:hypothetical protein
MCPAPGVLPDIHPNQNGYAVIARTFALTFGVR